VNLDEILGFEIIGKNKNMNDCDMITYFSLLFHKLFKKINDIEKCEIPNTIKYFTEESTYSSLIDSFSSEKRENYIKEGMEYGEKFFESMELMQDSINELG